jgi:hypothetical protein
LSSDYNMKATVQSDGNQEDQFLKLMVLTK